MDWFTTVGGGDEEQGGLRHTAGTEEGVEEDEGGERVASKTCSCAWFKLEETSPAVGSAAGVTVLACAGTDAAAGCRGGWVEWMAGGAVLGPVSS